MNIDEMIAKALEEEFEERVEQSMAETKKHRFSLAYRIWERKTLRDLRRERNNKPWTLKRTRTVVASAFAVVAVLIGGVAFAASNPGRYKLKDRSDHSEMFIENLSSDKTTLEEYYGLPEEDGWVLVNYDILDDLTMLKYECGEKKVTFWQEVIHEGIMSNINTEKAAVEPLSLYTENDGFILDFGEDWCAIYWIYDGYLLNFSSNFNKNDTINLVYSTKIINLPQNS